MSKNGHTLFVELTVWEREQALHRLSPDHFGDTQLCESVTAPLEMDTEPYPADLDTRRLPTIVDCDEA